MNEKNKLYENFRCWLEYSLNEWNGACSQCGGELVEIRGKHPKEPRRRVCATCLMEIIERAISNSKHASVKK